MLPTTLMMRTSTMSLKGFWTSVLFPKFVRQSRDIEKKLKFLESMKDAYAQLVTQKTKDHLPYKNALLTVVVSNQARAFQRYISRMISSTKYLLCKAIT
jgi:hypothetical protein